MSLKVSGIDKALRNLDRQFERMGGATRKGVEDVQLDLQSKSQAIVPHDTGDLEGSANTDFEETATGYSGSVYYNMPYAVVQHEDLEFRHEPGREAKYLEKPLKENRQRYIDYIARENRRVNQ